MTEYARYAIYYMPDPSGGLWRDGSAWLGRDAFGGEGVARPALEALASLNTDRLTAGPRHYGFHGTLKAPFEPAEGVTTAGLLRAVEDFASRRPAFDIALEVATLGDFVALRPSERVEDGDDDPMRDLHWDCVHELDRFRAPISDADLQRKRKARLTPDQDAYLVQWGYPYIFDQFRFHMTLTSRIACKGSQSTIADALTGFLEVHTATPHRASGLGLYAQVDRDAPFDVLAWCPLGGGETQRSPRA